jgi:CspA family cold shock protein
MESVWQKGLAVERDEERSKEMKNMSTGTSASEVAGERFTGRVEWFSERKGYGFIGWQGDKDVFVHRSAILGQGRRILQEGQRVEFGVRRTLKGLEAMNVIELPREAEQAIDHPEHSPQLSRGQVHRVKTSQKNSDSARTKAGPFVYSYTIQKGNRGRGRSLPKTRPI